MDIIPIYVLIVAFGLDLVLGDPKKLPHLIVGFGKIISKGEKWLNRNRYKSLLGALLATFLISTSFVIPYFILQWLHINSLPFMVLIFSIAMLFYCLANKTLIKEGQAVFDALEYQGLEAGQKRLSWIVGRETDKLDKQQIRIATFETMSENLSDGVIAPLFYFLLLGVPGAMAYKMINTLDSMIGYKNERFIKFGKFAARVDDIANYIPSRITALLILSARLKFKGISFVIKQGKNHSSPNAGYPEAALAYVLSCQFGGPNYYHGTLVNKPFIGHTNRKIKHKEIKTVTNINYTVSIVFVIIIIGILYLFQNV
ncbi:adenosylcobinamide-phosphate synthase CbiB [Aquimarina sp. W85]|uniref:adenosylcobinamide-phosphate synthase CbiB n=1 Tax=Aquimarina rhodophyticola TaxID=3342246 RepID=UPI00366E2DC7